MTEKATDQCVICLSSLPDEEKEVLPCMHFFHYECIKHWIDVSGSFACPVCRTDIRTGSTENQRGSSGSNGQSEDEQMLEALFGVFETTDGDSVYLYEGPSGIMLVRSLNRRGLQIIPLPDLGTERVRFYDADLFPFARVNSWFKNLWRNIRDKTTAAWRLMKRKLLFCGRRRQGVDQ